MQRCFSCNSSNVSKLGMRFIGRQQGRGFKCNACGEKFTIPNSNLTPPEAKAESTNKEELEFIRDEEYLDQIRQSITTVFVCAVNNSEVEDNFFQAIKTYCSTNFAKLVVLPVRYKNPSMLNGKEEVWYDSKLIPFMVENNFELDGNIRVLGNIKVQATVENPLSGIEGLSKGATVIIPHPQLALKTLPRQTEKYPAIATTTGAITKKHYSNTKAGFKAGFNHSYSAVVLEYDADGDHFIRHLNFDGIGFYDLDVYYGKYDSTRESIEALVTGDSHVMFHDKEVSAATFFNEDSIVKTLMPNTIVRHDVLDFFTRSHHSKDDHFLNYVKHHNKEKNNVAKELDQVIEFINHTTPVGARNVIVSSNHHSHLMRWLKETDPKTDPENALLYHWLSYHILAETTVDGDKIKIPDPFELYCEDKLDGESIFLGDSDSHKIFDIEVGLHGHIGINGSRGSSRAFSNVPMKTVIGHSHSPSIEKGCYCVGTSSTFKMPYVKGLSSWDHAHCLIHKNGKRQMVFIRNGKWRV